MSTIYLKTLFETLSNAEYHSHPALGASGLKALAKSPAHYQSALTTPRAETPALKLGSAVHCAVLEPKRFSTDYVCEVIDKRTKAGKERAAEHEEAGTIHLSPVELDAVMHMRDAVMVHKTAGDLFTDGRAELSVFATVDGVECKARPDWLRDDGVVVDLKTTSDASFTAFSRQIDNLKYYLQASFYLDVLNNAKVSAHRFTFCAVESAPPFAVAVYTLGDDFMDYAFNAHRDLLSLYKECMESNVWPGYEEDIMIIDLPKWKVKYE